MKTKLLTFILISVSLMLNAQSPLKSSTTIVNGYAAKSSGVDFWYHSSIPVAKESLLIRATDGNSSMEWFTSPVPQDINNETLTFIWLAGLGSSPGNASFDLEINGIKKFTFWTDGSNQWHLHHEDGSSLWFEKDLIDQHGDRFGFMALSIPARYLTPGQALRLKVTGGRHERTSWYMTFKFPLENGLNFRALPAIIESDGTNYQLGIAGILYFGEPSTAKVFIEGQPALEEPVNFGYNYLRVRLPEVEEVRNVDYSLEIAGQRWVGQIELQPVRRWRVNFVQHTHTDIGYTRPQTEILAEHLRFIDYALDYCDNTDHLPDEAKFRWTCEASWAVDEYLRSRPAAQIERLKQRVKEGRIEITGMYFNFNELPDEQILAASLQPLGTLRKHGFDVKTAMQNDVNGIGWSLIDYYHDMGVKYLNMGTHGHRALICFDKPTLFWWESPSGKRMLAWRGEHYMIGNTHFKVQTGNFNVFEDELLTYLTDLDAKGYEYDLISLQHSGFITDNSPPSTFMSETIRQWNEKYAWPKLKTASATEFFEEMEADYGREFQVIRGAWPDWWTDGFGASAREVAATRIAQSDLIANTAGLSMAVLQGALLPEKIADRIEAANSALLFYTEHTVGYSESVREPFHKYTMAQRALKESYAWEAGRRAKMLGEETMGLLQSFVKREPEPSLVVFNTLNWNRSGLMRVYIDHQIIPRYTAFSITDENGGQAKAQAVERHSDGTYWAIWVDDIPAFGFKKYIIKTEKDKLAKTTAPVTPTNPVFENEWYRIVIDSERGTVGSITDKELGLELVDSNTEWKFGEFIYELLDNRAQMESFRLDNFTREAPHKIWLDAYEENPVWNTFRFKGNTRAAMRDGAFEFEIRIFNTAKRIDFAYFIEKKLVTEPEGIYNAFPFSLKDGQLSFDVQGGEVRAGIDQVPGSANDWNTVQNYARLSNNEVQILLSSVEIPLMQFGGINTGRFVAGATPETTHIYGWPMNNYWVTNFNADQHGGIEWVYSMTSAAGNATTDATRFGWGHRTPLLSRVLPGGGSGDEQWQGSFIVGWPEHLLLISAIPEQGGKSAIFHVRDTGGKPQELKLRNNATGSPLKLTQVDVTGSNIKNGNVSIGPFESKFFRVEF